MGRKTIPLRHVVNGLRGELGLWKGAAKPEDFVQIRQAFQSAARILAQDAFVTLTDAQRKALEDYMDGGTVYPFD